MGKQYYKQCVLQRGNTKMVSWIPSEFAVVNNTLKLRGSKDEWTGGWLVTYAGEAKEARLVENLQHNAADIWKATSGECPRGNK